MNIKSKKIVISMLTAAVLMLHIPISQAQAEQSTKKQNSSV